jgi:predicted nucleic-acid-binding protein
MLQSKEFGDFDLIMELMNDENFRSLFDSQFNDFSNIKSILVIMKTYAYLEKRYIQEYGYKPSKDYMANGIQKLMRDNNTRKFLVESTRCFMNDTDTFDKIVNDNISNLPLITEQKNNDRV